MHRPRPFAVLILVAILVCLASLWPRVTSSDSVLRRITNTAETGINLNPSISGDGRRIAFESTEDLTNAGGASGFHAVQADLTTNPTQFLRMALSRAAAPGISQDGSRTAFASSSNPLGQNFDGNSEIFLFDSLANVAALKQITDTTPATSATRVQDGNFQPSISDDGRFIAFSSNRNFANQNGDGNLEAFVFDTTAQTFTQITNTTGVVGASNVKISGDGSRIAYVSDAGTALNPNRDLLLYSRPAATAQTIAAGVNTVALTYGRAISDDGTRVVYSLQTATNTTQVFLFDSRANGARQITTLGARATDVPLNATISGDGKRIAFATRRNPLGTNSDASVELFLYDIPTAQLTQITSATKDATAEVISSLSDDGSVVVFSFPRVLSGAVANSDFADNCEIYSVSLAPRASSGTATILNGASFGNDPSSPKAIAPDSIAVAQGGALASVTQQAQPLAGGSFPLSLADTTVTVNGRAAQILFISPSQVNFLTPRETAVGPATVVVTNSDGFQTIGPIMVLSTAPGIFTHSGNGVGEGVILNAETLAPGPFDPTNGKLRLLVNATGVRGGSHVTATIGGQSAPVEAVHQSTELPGLDEVQVFVPASLRGAGTVELVLQSDGQPSNPVSLTLSGSPLRDIMINEVLADPPGAAAGDLQGDANHDGVRSSSDDEFVELVNSTTHDIDLSGYQLLTRSSSATTDTLRHSFTAGTILPACSAIVVFGGGNPDPSNPLFGGAQVVKTSSGLSLSNSGGVITLRDNAAEVVTSFAYGGSTGLNGGASQSLTRSPDVTGNFVLHQSASGSGGKPFSSGTRLTAAAFAPCPAVARVDLSPASAAIDAGAKQQFSARAFDAAGNEVFGVIFSWQSSNTSAATIDQAGVATAVAEGSTEIRASGRGAQSAPATLTVHDIQRVLTSIDVSPSSATIPATGAQQFTGHGLDQFGNEIAGLSFTWESTNTNAATIDQAGLATGINQGQSTIKASSQGVTGIGTLNVTAPTIVVNEVLADPGGSVGTDLQGDANHDGVRSASDDEFVELVNATGAGISLTGWTVRTRATGGTSETTRHTFAAGTTLPTGEAIVVFGGGTFNQSDPVFGCAQVVKASSGGLSLTNTGLSILIRDGGGTLVSQMSYGGEGNNDQSLTHSPDISGAFVQHQAATGANGRRFSPGVRVDGSPFGNCPGHPASVTILPPTASVIAGQTTQFTAQVFDQFGRAMIGVPITFASDNTTAATVDSVFINPSTGIATATVSGHDQGTAHITAQSNDGTTAATSSQATLTVIPPQPSVSRIDVSPAVATINRGNTQQFNATAFDQNNQPVSGVFFTWASSNANAATTDPSGLATGVGIGAATITASASDGASGTVSGTATLNVQVPLVINEINADVGPDNVLTTAIEGDANRDGVRNSSDDEFVELFNNSNASVDISGIVIADAASNRFTIPANTTLASGRAVVIFGGGSPPVNAPAFGGALVLALTGSATLSLNDAGDTVNVKLNVGGSDVLIASQTYAGAGNPAAPSDQSLTRSPDAEISSNGGSFGGHTTATNAAGRVFSPGTRVDGTPFGSPAITRIDVTPASATINAGQTQAFTARAFSNVGGPEVEVQNVCFIWESSDPSKATVAPTTGVSTTATGVGGGSPTIRARAGGQLGTATLTVNVPPTLTINDVALNEGNSGTTTFHFVVSLSAPALTGGVTFDIATQDNTATVANNDYEARTLTGQTIAAGQQTYDFDVTVNGDANIEPNETFLVNVSNVSGATVGDGQGVGTIQNDDSPSLNINDVLASEGNGGTTTFTFTVTSTLPAPAGGITFDIATQDSTATVINNDYVARSLTSQTIPAGQTTYTFDVTVNGDLLVEPNETFSVNLSNVVNATIGDGQGLGTIQNDDTPQVVISQLYGGGGNSGATFKNDFIELFNRGTTTVDLSGWSVQQAAATGTSWSVTPLCPSGTCLLTPGKYFLVQEFSGAAVGATLPTPDAVGTSNLSVTSGKIALVDSTTALTLSGCPFGASVIDFVGYGTTADCSEGSTHATAHSNTSADFRKSGGCTDTNDNAADFVVSGPNPRNSAAAVNDCSTGFRPDISINDVTVTEGDTGTKTVDFTLTLSAPNNAQTVAVNYATADGTAAAGLDYQSTSATVSFAPGETSKPITITIIGDTTDEPNETFFVNLSNASNAVILDHQGQGTITDDDVPPTLTINDVSLNEGNGGTTTFHFVVSLSAPALTGGVTFDIATQDNTATVADNDYVAHALISQTIPAGQQTYSFDVTVNGDVNIEPNESFFVNVTNVSGATVGDAQGAGTIQNDDSPSLNINDVTASEGNSGTTTFTFTVTSTLPAPAGGITFDIATANNTATVANNDYVARSLTSQTITAGQTTYTFDVTVNGDTLVEADESFFVNISNAINASIGDGQGVGTIQNDDTPVVVISQVYGGGGNTGAQFKNDFIELFNRGTTTVDLAGWSVQGAAAAGISWTATPLCPTGPCLLAPGKYFLVQGAGGAVGANLPTPDATGSINLSATAAKVALVSNATALAVACPSGSSILDLVGFGGAANCFEGTGPATAPSNTTADFRKAGGCTDTNDNAGDFFVSAPFPRNSSSPTNNCTAGTPPNLTIDDVSVTEGNSGTTTATFTVSLSAPAPSTDVTFDIATQNNTALAGSDYVTRTLTNQIIPAGQTTYTFSVTVNGDVSVEPDETFFVNVTNVSGATVTDGQGMGTIQNDDFPTLSINDVSANEGNSGTTAFTFTVSLSAPAPSTVTFDIATQDNSATTADSDYVAHSLTGVTIAAGLQTATFDVTVNGDTNVEANESFVVNVTNVSGATIVDGQGLGTIQNDDSPTLSITPALSLAEGNSGSTVATFTVTLSPAINQTVTVDYATANGSATAGTDYQATNGTLTFNPLETSKPINVTVNGDTLVETDETFTVSLSNASANAAISATQGTGTGTITNDDTPLIVISQAYGGGGNSGAQFKNDFIEIFNRGTSTVDLAGWSVQETSATGTSWSATPLCASGPCLLAPGKYFLVGEASGGAVGSNLPTADAIGTISMAATSGKVALVNGATPLTGACPAGVTILDFVGYGTTADCFEGSNHAPAPSNTTADFRKSGGCVDSNDNAADFVTSAPNPRNSSSPANDCSTGIRPDISINDPAAVTEGDSGTTTLTFTVSLSVPNNTQTVTVNYATADGTATAGADYQSASGAVTFLPTETSKPIVITINSDLLDEPNETFLVNLSTPINGAILDPQGQGTINDNDPTPTLSINDLPSIAEGNSGTSTATFTVTLSAASGQTVTVNYATADGTATAGSDYIANSGTLTFNPGETTKPVLVTINGDTTFEPNETFFVNLTTPVNATISDTQGQGTIINDDAAPPTPNITIGDPSVSEGDTGTKTLGFTVSLSISSATIVTVDYATASAAPATGVATAGTDYVAANGTVTFNPGETSKPVSITINGDKLVEPDETFFVNLTNASVGSTITDSQGVGTITNDDAPNLVISQIYPGGNNAGATYQNDFIEIFNRGTTTVDFTVTPYSVQYAGATASFGVANTKTDLISGSIAPGHYFLIQESGGTTNGVALPTPDATGNIALAASAGKVALVLTTAAVNASACPGATIPATSPSGNNIVDFVGYGSGANCFEGAGIAPFSTSTAGGLDPDARSTIRKSGGCQDTGDNASDFTNPTTAPIARNLSTTAAPCP